MALTKHKRLTVAGLRELKGKRQLTMLFVETPDEAAAAAAAGIDILSIVEAFWSPSSAPRRNILDTIDVYMYIDVDVRHQTEGA